MVVYELAPIGGLEEIVTILAVTLKEYGVTVSLVSADFVPESNQYRTQLDEKRIPLRHLARWLAMLSKDWPTKERYRMRLMKWLRPIVWLMALALVVSRGVRWPRAVASSEGWLGGQLMARFLAPDYRRKLLIWQLAWWRARWRPDILHVHGYTNLVAHVHQWAHQHGIPAIYQEHSTPHSGSGQWHGYEPVNQADAVLAVSNACAVGLHDVCGITLPVLVVPALVRDPGRLSLSQHGQSIRATTFANLYPVKGLGYLLQAITYVRDKHPEVDFRIFGDGPLRDELVQYAVDSGLDGDRIFRGSFRREELPSIMEETDIFVMSSLTEAMPVSLIEAKAYGRCIVATAVGGIPELISDGSSGLLCPPRDPVALAEQILRVVCDPVLRTELGRQARHEFENSWFHPKRAIDIYLDLYRDVLAGNTPVVKGRDYSSGKVTPEPCG